MNSELIECPACKHALRVPENLFGKIVRCPECKTHFTAPTRDADGKFGAPTLLPAPVPSTTLARPKRFSDSPFFVPASLLVLVSTIGTLVNGYQAITWHVDRGRAEKAVTWLIEQYANFSRQEVSPDDAQTMLDAAVIVHHVVFAMSLISLAGGIAMLFLRYRWLGILGSVLAMINVANCCCMPGIPIGGYCIIKLIDPDLTILFRRK